MDSHSNDTKIKIMQAAIKVFAENGFSATSVRNITSEAGVNLSALNYHFGSKEDLFLEIITSFSSKFRQTTELLKEAKSTEEVRIRLEMFLQNFIDFSIREFASLNIFFREHDLIVDKYLETTAKDFLAVREAFKDFLQQAIDKGLIRKVHTEVFWQHFFSSMKGESSECSAKEKLNLPSILDDDYKKIYIEESMNIYWSALRPEEVKND